MSHCLLGWACFKTQSSDRFNRYLSYQVIYAVPLAERWTVKGGGGLMGGLTVRQDTPSTFLSNVRPLLSKEEQELIIKLHTRAKYLFFGLASKINVEYTLSPKWAVGMGGNFHYIFNRNFEEDVKIVFLSLYGKVALLLCTPSVVGKNSGVNFLQIRILFSPFYQ